MKSEHTGGADLVQAESVPLDFLGVGLCSLQISDCRADAVKCQPGQGVCVRSSPQDGVGHGIQFCGSVGVNASPLPFVLHSDLVTSTEHLSLLATDLCVKKMQHKDVLSVLLRRSVSLLFFME